VSLDSPRSGCGDSGAALRPEWDYSPGSILRKYKVFAGWHPAEAPVWIADVALCSVRNQQG